LVTSKFLKGLGKVYLKATIELRRCTGCQLHY